LGSVRVLRPHSPVINWTESEDSGTPWCVREHTETFNLHLPCDIF
jgi:hypothetical protein